MDTQQVKQLQALISGAEFLNQETKQIFLSKLAYLPENKLNDLLEIFAHDQAERNKLKQQKMEIFARYKSNLTEIYRKAKEQILSIKESKIKREENQEMQNLDLELKQI